MGQAVKYESDPENCMLLYIHFIIKLYDTE